MMRPSARLLPLALLSFAGTCPGQSPVAAQAAPVLLPPIPASVSYAPANRKLPSIFFVGDSTIGRWGPPVVDFFDPKKINVVLAGAGGRSSRTYISEGIWKRVLAEVRPNDIVVIHLGRNDGGAINDNSRARGTLPGTGEETQDIDNQMTLKPETVHTFGYYLRQFVRDVRGKGARPIIMSPTPMDRWKDGHIMLVDTKLVEWSKAVATEEHCEFFDATDFMILQYEQLGQEKTASLYDGKDWVHVGKEGGELNAVWTIEGLKALTEVPIGPYLSKRGAALPTVALR